MKVTLVNYTGMNDPNKHAAIDLLIFSKSTRLNMSAGLMADIAAMSIEKKLDELDYMSKTIPSSWEFLNYTFLIEGVTRAFTHQIVRSRQFSFAQQTMRILDVAGWQYATGPTISEDENRKKTYDDCMSAIASTYSALVGHGAAIEDARGVLPTNILTNIMMAGNMRNFVEMFRKRASDRTQGEYRDVRGQMVAAILAVHPWMDMFLNRSFENAAKELGDELRKLLPKDEATRLVKLLDEMRKG